MSTVKTRPFYYAGGFHVSQSIFPTLTLKHICWTLQDRCIICSERAYKTIEGLSPHSPPEAYRAFNGALPDANPSLTLYKLLLPAIYRGRHAYPMWNRFMWDVPLCFVSSLCMNRNVWLCHCTSNHEFRTAATNMCVPHPPISDVVGAGREGSTILFDSSSKMAAFLGYLFDRHKLRAGSGDHHLRWGFLQNI